MSQMISSQYDKTALVNYGFEDVSYRLSRTARLSDLVFSFSWEAKCSIIFAASSGCIFLASVLIRKERMS